MPTRNRREWLPQAIRCYQAQTYQPRELLILADGDDVRDLIPQDPSIRLAHVEGAPLIGDKRNFGCTQARGEIIAHFDDDDTSEPGRLADQVERLMTTGKAVTGYASMYFVDPIGEWWRYQGKAATYALGTSLCYRRDWWDEHRFPRLQVGEDNDFVGLAVRAGQFAGSPREDMMYATIHPGNTSPRNRSGSWQQVKGFSWGAA